MVIGRQLYRNRKCSLASSLLVVLCTSAQVYAADDDYLNMDLEQLLQVPVTGSTLRDESLKTVPAAVTVFTHDQLENLGMDYLYELVGLVPGYQFDRGGDNGVNYTLSSNGRRNGAQAREILVVMDGRILANPRTGSADVSLPLIPLEQIERVEIIRGPGSAIYGSSAFSGVINIITRTAQNVVKVEVGSDDRRNASVMVTKPLGNWSATVYARAYEDSGQDYWVKDSFTNTPLKTQDPRQTLDVDLGLKKNETQVRAAYHQTSTHDFYSVENIQNGFNSFNVWLKQFSIDQGFHWWEGITTHVYLGYLANQQDFHVAVLGTGALAQISQPSSNEPLLAKVTLAGENFNVRVTNDWVIDDLSSALLGLEWKKDRESSAYANNNYDLGQLAGRDFPIRYYGDFNRSTPLGRMNDIQSAGVYGQYQRNLGAHTGLTVGLRYDNYNEFGAHVSPRVGLVHQLTSTQTLKLLYGEAYRAPSLSETGVINNPLVVGTPNLNYEIVKTWDLIWLANWKTTSISVGGFRNSYRDAIVAGFIGTTRTFVNGGDEYSDGVALDAKKYFTQEWSVRATYTHFLSLPPTAFREAEQLASLELNFNQGAWNWNLLGYHQRERYALGANNSRHELADFWVINSKLRYRFSAGYNLSLQFKNMDDRHFSTPAQGVNLPQGVPNRGREVSVALNWAL